MSSKTFVWIIFFFTYFSECYHARGNRGIQKSIDRIGDEVETSFDLPGHNQAEDSPLPPTTSLLLNHPSSLSSSGGGISSGNPSYAQIAHIKLNRENPAPRLLTRAIAIIRGNGPVKGVIYLQQMRNGPVLIHGTLNGFPKAGEYGFHFHQFPVEGDDCESAGEHYNPYHDKHGGKDDSSRHLGDLGNIAAHYHGTAHVTISDRFTSLSGPNSILGRSLVIHEKKDDLGRGLNSKSQKTGNSGGRLGCGNVVLLKPPYTNLVGA